MAKAEEEIIPVEVYNAGFEEVENFEERSSASILFYADVKIFLPHNEFLYANTSKLAKYKFFHDYFSDHNTKKDEEGFYHFRYEGMRKETWLPILYFIYGKEEQAFEELTKIILEEQTERFRTLLKFVEASALLDFCTLLQKLFNDICLLDRMKIYEVFRSCCRYNNSLCPPEKEDQPVYSLKTLIMNRITIEFKNNWNEIAKNDLFHKMSFFDLNDFELACDRFFSPNYSNYPQYLILFFFCFKAEILENSKERLNILTHFSPKIILNALHITNMIARCPKYANEVVQHCTVSISQESKPKVKRAKTSDLGGFTFGPTRPQPDFRNYFG